MRRVIFVVTFVLIPVILFAQAVNSDKEILELINQLTLEEKAKIVVGMGMDFPGAPPSNEPAVGQTESLVEGAAGTTYGIPRLGIPSIVMADGPAGIRLSPKRKNDSTRTYYATAFQIATSLASSWDMQLIEEVGKAIGQEALEYGVDIMLMPALNLHRNPLCGRNFEYFSEDPLLSGSSAAAMIKGVQSNGVGTSIKHFVANNQETNRNIINTIVDERTLRELYLKGFEIAVKEAQPWTVMSSYNKLNGNYTSHSYDHLTKILRDDWKFEGFVMTDWFGGKDPIEQMKAGNDLLMPGVASQTQKIIEAVNTGQLDEEILNLNVKRILNIIRKTPSFKKYVPSNNPDLSTHAQLCRKAAAEGMVLLKNDNLSLPLEKQKKIALFGITAYEMIIGGTGSGDVKEAYIVNLDNALSSADFILDDSICNGYKLYLETENANRPKPLNPFIPVAPISEMEMDKELISYAAKENQVALIVLGRNSGEFADRTLENDFLLNSVEKDLIKNVSEEFHKNNKKVIVVLNIGGVIETQDWVGYPNAILIAWQPGQESGNSIADVLSGKVNPSGKLASTFPKEYADLPSSKNFPGTPEDKPTEVVYAEGLNVGYRYFCDSEVKPEYEFGFGLSYTAFDYSDPVISTAEFKDKIQLKLNITNAGEYEGKEVVQVYIAAPDSKLKKPSMELRKFAKTKLLKPGESESITFDITSTDLCSFDAERSSWVAEPGEYVVKVAASSADIRGSVSFILPNDILVEKVNSKE